MRSAEEYSEQRLRPYVIRPFERRWCYYSPIQPLWNRPRPSVWAQCWEGNAFFVSRFRTSSDREGIPSYFVTGLLDDHLITPDASCFAIRLRKKGTISKKDIRTQHFAFHPADSTVANLSGTARQYLKEVDVTDPDQDAESAGITWMHALAVTFSALYLSENADGIWQDWPRIPLPKDAKLLLASAELGRAVAALLDSEQQVPGVTAGTLRPELRAMGVLESTVTTPVNLEVTAGWGHAGKGGVTMPDQACPRSASTHRRNATRSKAARPKWACHPRSPSRASGGAHATYT